MSLFVPVKIDLVLHRSAVTSLKTLRLFQKYKTILPLGSDGQKSKFKVDVFLASKSNDSCYFHNLELIANKNISRLEESKLVSKWCQNENSTFRRTIAYAK